MMQWRKEDRLRLIEIDNDSVSEVEFVGPTGPEASQAQDSVSEVSVPLPPKILFADRRHEPKVKNLNGRYSRLKGYEAPRRANVNLTPKTEHEIEFDEFVRTTMEKHRAAPLAAGAHFCSENCADVKRVLDTVFVIYARDLEEWHMHKLHEICGSTLEKLKNFMRLRFRRTYPGESPAFARGKTWAKPKRPKYPEIGLGCGKCRYSPTGCGQCGEPISTEDGGGSKCKTFVDRRPKRKRKSLNLIQLANLS